VAELNRLAAHLLQGAWRAPFLQLIADDGANRRSLAAVLATTADSAAAGFCREPHRPRGFTGVSWHYQPDTDRHYLLMTNRTHPAIRLHDTTALRREFLRRAPPSRRRPPEPPWLSCSTWGRARPVRAPDIDPWLLLPLDESEIFFAGLPARQPVRPSVLSVTLLAHAALLALFIHYERKVFSGKQESLKTAIERFARGGEPAAPSTRSGAGAAALPRRARPHARAKHAPAQRDLQSVRAIRAAAPPEEQAKIDERTRKYTHVNQEEQAAQKPNEKNLFSDKDRKGASPETARIPTGATPIRSPKAPTETATPSPRPPNVPGEPGTRDKMAGAPGSDKKAGQNGENGTQMAQLGGPVAYNPSTHSIYGVQLAPGKGRIPRGQPGQRRLKHPRPTAGSARENPAARGLTEKKAGAPGENDKTAAMARRAKPPSASSSRNSPGRLHPASSTIRTARIISSDRCL